MVLDASTVIGADRDSIMFGVDGFNGSVVPACETQPLTPASIENDIADFVASRVGALSSGEIAVDENGLVVTFCRDATVVFEQSADGGVELAALVIGGTDN